MNTYQFRTQVGNNLLNWVDRTFKGKPIKVNVFAFAIGQLQGAYDESTISKDGQIMERIFEMAYERKGGFLITRIDNVKGFLVDAKSDHVSFIIGSDGNFTLSCLWGNISTIEFVPEINSAPA